MRIKDIQLYRTIPYSLIHGYSQNGFLHRDNEDYTYCRLIACSSKIKKGIRYSILGKTEEDFNHYNISMKATFMICKDYFEKQIKLLKSLKVIDE